MRSLRSKATSRYQETRQSRVPLIMRTRLVLLPRQSLRRVAIQIAADIVSHISAFPPPFDQVIYLPVCLSFVRSTICTGPGLLGSCTTVPTSGLRRRHRRIVGLRILHRRCHHTIVHLRSSAVRHRSLLASRQSSKIETMGYWIEGGSCSPPPPPPERPWL